MHRLSAGFVLGYHGCYKDVGERILKGDSFQPSKNDYDWLGHGIYFWEANPNRGIEFIREKSARDKKAGRRTGKPFVVGAVLDLGNCLDMTTSAGVEAARAAHATLAKEMAASGDQMPVKGNSHFLRPLDCAVLNKVVQIVSLSSALEAIDSVKGAFIEGDPIYPASGFREKTHIQISILNAERCIKGVFRVPEHHLRS